MSKELEKMVIYSHTDLVNRGYRFATLSINRAINANALKKKKASIKVTGVICPCLVITADKCLEDNLSVEIDGVIVTKETADLDKILVIVDGQHRAAACKELNKEAGSGGNYECYYYLPMTEKSISSLLKEANVATSPWKGGDFLTYVILNAPSDIETTTLKFVQSILSVCGDTAAWLWGTLDLGRVYSKDKLIRACKPENKSELQSMASTVDFEYGKVLYEAAKKTLGIELVKLKVVPTTLIEIIKTETVTSAKAELIPMMEKFLGEISPYDAKSLRAIKKAADKSKDDQIRDKLRELWQQFKSKPATPTPPTASKEEPSHDEGTGEPAVES